MRRPVTGKARAARAAPPATVAAVTFAGRASCFRTVTIGIPGSPTCTVVHSATTYTRCVYTSRIHSV